MASACRGADWEQQIRALRPADTGASENAVLDELQQRAEASLAAIKHATTREQADAERKKLREELTRSLGLELLPKRPNLHVRDVGTVSRDGYHIEKIVFQSLPGVSVPAHVYVPNGIKSRAPAVLFYVGHWWPDAKTKPDFQAFCINMARLGFVVLTWDPFGQGERGISSRDHRRTESLVVGVAQQGIAEYETRCALQYLLTRKDVDPERIGMTGASGGGYNTWITAGLDDRIKVAVPVVGTSEFFEQISVARPLDWYHGSEHCHYVPGLIRYANNHEFVAMAAPKPLMIIAASHDQSFPIAGVKTIYSYGRDLYRSYDVPDKIGFFEDTEEGHGYQKRKREAAYGWFLRYLMNRGDGGPYAEPETVPSPFDAAELRCFPEGKNEAAGPGIVETVRGLAAELPEKRSSGSLEQRMHWPAAPPIAPPRISDARVQRVVIPSENGLPLPAFLLRPEGDVHGLLVAADDRGKEAIASQLPFDDILRSGWAVLAVDPRGIGELATSKMGWVAAVSLLLNENFVGRQAFDMARAVELAHEAFPDKPVGIYTNGSDVSLAGAYVVAHCPELRFYVLQNGFASYRQFFDRPRSLATSFELKKDDRDRTSSFDREIPFAYVPFDALRGLDLPDLLARSRARGLVANPIDGDWAAMDQSDARKTFGASIGVITGPGSDAGIRDFLKAQLNNPQVAWNAQGRTH